MSKKHYRVRNWADYNKALVNRGRITLWIDEKLLTERTPLSLQRGRPNEYSDALIRAALLLKNVFHLTFRSLQGFLESISSMQQLNINIPDYTTLCRRQHQITVSSLAIRPANTPIDVVVDSTGLKIYGEGEWCVRQHGKHYQRTWRKIHLAIDAGSLAILACTVTTSRVQDSTVLPTLLENIQTPINRIMGDGAYDTFGCYDIAQRRGASGIFPPPHRARLSSETKYHQKAASPEAIEQRDKAVHRIRCIGKAEWKKEVGYHQRSLAETTMYRLKQLLGERFNAKLPSNQLLEITLRCHILNKMIALGRPLSIAV